jgi:uncharacterized protein YcaQ
MPNAVLPPATTTLSKTHARSFLLAHQRLWPPRRLEGKAGILDFVRHVGCIQFDPINVVGRNPDLVLQSRVIGYRPSLLEELLYVDRALLDGWDKVASIYPTADWPHFARHRYAQRLGHRYRTVCSDDIAQKVIAAIRERGPLSSLDLKHEGTLLGFWGREVRLGNAALEMLYAAGDLVVHSRSGTRRFFDLAEHVLPAQVLASSDPYETDETYRDWHVLRRVGGLGLANPSAAEYWQGIFNTDGQARRTVLARLAERGDLLPVAVEGANSRTFFLRTADLPTLQAIQTDGESSESQAAIIGALDNLMWDRSLLRWVFDFDYVWEVYKPLAQRKYGYYVLPVLYGDRFVARFQPAFDRTKRVLTIDNWWWEEGVRPDAAMESALAACLGEFIRYLSADRVALGERIAGEDSLGWVLSISA